jgi:hypothetical protein
MSSFPRDFGSEFKSRASDKAYGGEPPSPAGYLALLGVLILVALRFGLCAQFLVGAP